MSTSGRGSKVVGIAVLEMRLGNGHQMVSAIRQLSHFLPRSRQVLFRLLAGGWGQGGPKAHRKATRSALEADVREQYPPAPGTEKAALT